MDKITFKYFTFVKRNDLLKIPEMKITILSAFLILLFITNCICAQSVSNNPGVQDSLSKLSSCIWKQKTDSARLQANAIFMNKFQSVLNSGLYVDIPFDSINGIARVASDDGFLRIFTWNIPLSDGTNKYFGFIQHIKDSNVVIPLQSIENEPNDLSVKLLTPKMWYGALYYKLIQVEIGGKMAYTLLGWDGYTNASNRKFIDMLHIDDNGNILFGMPVFKTDKGIKSRVILEYAEKANLLLRYDYQAIKVEKRKKIKNEPAWLIVMDHLVPTDPSMKGMQKYYVPSGDTYDGFIFKEGYWVLVEDIVVANKPKSTKQLPE
jgi:hypothetical protein